LYFQHFKKDIYFICHVCEFKSEQYISIIGFLGPCWLTATGLIFTCSSLLIGLPFTLISTSNSIISFHSLLAFNLPHPNYTLSYPLTTKGYSLYFYLLKQSWSFPFIFLVFVKNLEIEVVVLESIEIELIIKIAIADCCWEELSSIASPWKI
jgi:hypothetical protein